MQRPPLNEIHRVLSYSGDFTDHLQVIDELIHAAVQDFEYHLEIAFITVIRIGYIRLAG